MNGSLERRLETQGRRSRKGHKAVLEMCHHRPHIVPSVPWLLISDTSQNSEDGPLTPLSDQNCTIINMHFTRDRGKRKKKKPEKC